MSNVTVFENEMFGNVRVVEINGEPWFVGKDVCNCLDIRNSRDAIARLDNDEKNTVVLTDGTPGNPNKTVVSEPGLYTLVLSSRKPEAKEFKRWVVHEVIPSIRKHGVYATPEELVKMLSRPEYMYQVMLTLQEEQNKRRELEQTVSEMEPKVDCYNRMIDSEELLTITTIAKSYGMTARDLNAFLHNAGVQFKTGNTWCLYSKYQNEDYTRIVTVPSTRGGMPVSFTMMRWTQKGRVFIDQLLRENGYKVVEEVA